MSTTDGVDGEVLPLPHAGRQERAKTGRKKAAPRAKLTMEMLAKPTGVDALLESLRQTRLNTLKNQSLCIFDSL